MSENRYEQIEDPADRSEYAPNESVDEIEFECPTDRLARRPARRPLEPGFGRKLSLAAIAGIGMGIGVYFFKPEPHAATAAPVQTPSPVQTYVEPQGLFQLPPWDDSAYRRDVAAGRISEQ